MTNLSGKICLVTGASRGIGRGIAIQLVAYGATCYITGRNESTLQLVKQEAMSRGVTGKCIPLVCDHSDDESVQTLFQTISSQQRGQLDLLVNNAYSAVNFILENSEVPFWDQPDDSWDVINRVGLRNHFNCTVQAARLMVPRRRGLIINISSVGGKVYFQLPQYGVGKAGKDRMARDCAEELRKYNVAFVSLWPGPVKTEVVEGAREKARMGKELTKKQAMLDLLFSRGESTEFAGKCIAHLVADPHVMRRSGQILFTTDLASEFNFKDVDGSLPLSMRSINFMLRMGGLKRMSDYLPDWLQIPRSIYMMMLSVAPTPTPSKRPSKYE